MQPHSPGGVVSNYPLGSQFGKNTQIDWEHVYVFVLFTQEILTLNPPSKGDILVLRNCMKTRNRRRSHVIPRVLMSYIHRANVHRENFLKQVEAPIVDPGKSETQFLKFWDFTQQQFCSCGQYKMKFLLCLCHWLSRFMETIIKWLIQLWQNIEAMNFHIGELSSSALVRRP